MNSSIELEIKEKCSEANSAVEKLVSTMTSLEKSIDKTNTSIKGLSVSKNIKSKSKDIDSLSSSFKKLNTVFNYALLKKGFSNFNDWLGISIDYTEQLNLFDVVMDKAINKATKFQNTMSNAFGTNPAQQMQYQALYKSMAQNMGIGEDYAYMMSENSTKLINDLASLYNKDENSVAEALRAGIYAGQTKPLRSFGIDVTQTSLKPIADELGIDKSMNEFSQAEKQILRYIAVLRQSSIAHGDFANTIESPANQLKVFKNQLIEAKRALANLFIGGFSAMLPYANAILMVVKEVANAIGSFFGIKVQDYNTSISSSLGDVADGYGDIADGANKATGAAKELKRETLGFDQINNISEDKSSGSGSGGSSGGGISGSGIDQRLLDALYGYDNGMDKIRMKASDIRDKIMEWLGFTKLVNDQTGEVKFIYGGIKKTIKNMIDSFMGLNTEGKIFVSLGIALTLSKIFSIGKKIFEITGAGKLLGNIKSFSSPLKDLLGLTISYTKETGSLISGLGNSMITFSQCASGAEKLNIAMLGLVGSAIGVSVVNDGLVSMQENGANLTNVLQSSGGAFLSTASAGVALGSSFGLVGAVIGGTAGAVASLIPAFTKWKEITSTNSKVCDEYREKLALLNKTGNEYVATNSAQIQRSQELSTELEGLIDSNGRVKAGYEDRANFILTTLNNALGTEYQMTDGIITLNGQQIKTYQDIKSNIDRMVQSKLADIKLKAYEDEYIEALKIENETQQKLADKKVLLKQLQENYNTAMQNGGKIGDTSAKDILKAQEKVKNQIIDLESTHREVSYKVKSYEDMVQQNLSGNYDEMEKTVEDFVSGAKKNYTDLKDHTKTIGNNIKTNLETPFNSINGKKATINLSANTDGATRSLNDFGGKLNNAGLGNVFKPIKYTCAYANGGFPEDGMFFANHGELVGKFSNGKTAVANNAQIIEGIKQGVMEAMNNTSGGLSDVHVYVHADESIIVDRINKETTKTGICPIITTV